MSCFFFFSSTPPAGLLQDVSTWFPRCTVRHQDHQEQRRSTLELGGTRLHPGRDIRVQRLLGGEECAGRGSRFGGSRTPTTAAGFETRTDGGLSTGLCARVLRPEQPVDGEQPGAEHRPRGLHEQTGDYFPDSGSQRKGVWASDSGQVVAGRDKHNDDATAAADSSYGCGRWTGGRALKEENHNY